MAIARVTMMEFFDESGMGEVDLVLIRLMGITNAAKIYHYLSSRCSRV